MWVFYSTVELPWSDINATSCGYLKVIVLCNPSSLVQSLPFELSCLFFIFSKVLLSSIIYGVGTLYLIQHETHGGLLVSLFKILMLLISSTPYEFFSQ